MHVCKDMNTCVHVCSDSVHLCLLGWYLCMDVFLYVCFLRCDDMYAYLLWCYVCVRVYSRAFVSENSYEYNCVLCGVFVPFVSPFCAELQRKPFSR